MAARLAICTAAALLPSSFSFAARGVALLCRSRDLTRRPDFSFAAEELAVCCRRVSREGGDGRCAGAADRLTALCLRASYKSNNNEPIVSRDLSTTRLDSDDASSSSAVSRLDELLSLIQDAPTGRATPLSQTRQILDCVRELEAVCPTSNDQSVLLAGLAGAWDLLWTAQDPLAPESQQRNIFATWINPLENQAYSNNPQSQSGQANPFLPVSIQNRLEKAGILSFASSPVRSTQAIDIKSGKIRNIVTVSFNNTATSSNEDDSSSKSGTTSKAATTTQNRRASATAAILTVTVSFTPDRSDPRRINVKFDACRVSTIPKLVDWEFPLGLIGPTGWLRTVYLDDTVRVTRGHKGSVFILSRPFRGRAT